MISFKWRKSVHLALAFLLLLSLIVPFDLRSADAAPKGIGSREYVRISSGTNHSIALKSDGTVVAWGDNSDGQTTVPAGLSDVASVAAGYHHSLALKADGTVVAWGSNEQGQTTVPGGLTDVKSVAAGQYHSLALKSDGTVVGWGNNDFGQRNVPTGLTDVVSVAAGSLHSLALKSDGTVVAWGFNDHGQRTVPAGLTDVVSIAGGAYHSLALKSDGTVVAWGWEAADQTSVLGGLTGVTSISAGVNYLLALKSDGTIVGWGQNERGQTSVPAGTTGVAAIAAGGYHSLALQSDGTIVAWGDNEYGQRSVPADFASPIKGSRIAAGFYHSLALQSDGTVVGWGNNAYGQSNAPGGLTDVVSIASGLFHSLALQSDGTVVAWGSNDFGESTVPGGLVDVVSIAAAGRHSLALQSDGTVVAWGMNTSGQVTVPPTLSDVVSIAAGGAHSLALQSDGTVVGWGNNDYGQSNAPGGLTGVVSIAAGLSHSLALQSDGTVVGWGRNNTGQRDAPGDLTGAVAIAAGDIHSLALKSDGTVVAWGSNGSGQSNVPAELTGVVSIAGGVIHSLALQSDGSVVGWGSSTYGQTNVPGHDNLSALTLQEGDFTESFQPSVTSYTSYYNGQLLNSIDVTATLADTTSAALYVNNEPATSGVPTTINIAGATTDTYIPVRVEPYLKPSKTYTIKLVIDSTAPVVQFSTNGRTAAAASASSVVTASDSQSGVDSASLQYVWTQSTAVPTGGWSTFSDGDTLSQTTGDGSWYLHIRATDKVGNVSDTVSNPFVLDNTSPTVTVSASAGGTVNTAFPVTVTFSEGVSGFTEDDLVIGNGAVSDFVAVSPAIYTATVSPVTSGQAVTVTVAAGAASDAAGHHSPASNTLSLMYDTTKPVVTFGGFTDGQRFSAPPAAVTVSVNEAVYWIAGGAELTSANALPLLGMQKDGIVFTSYTPSYDELTRTFTLSFTDTLEDGVYEVLVDGNVVANINQNMLDAASASFTVAVPVITGVTVNPTSLTSAGGSTTAAITGINLLGQTVSVYVDGVAAATAVVSSAASAEAAVSIPRNAIPSAKTHIVTVYLNGVEAAGQSSVVTVSAAPPIPIPTPTPIPTPIPSSDAGLAQIDVYTSGQALGLSPVFAPGVTEYTAETDAEQVELLVVSDHAKAIVKLLGERIDGMKNIPLAMGANVLTITVQAEDGTLKRYTLTINRIDDNEQTAPSAPACPFTDIEDHWAQSDICEAAGLGIVEGVHADTFEPNRYVTRTEFAVMLQRTLHIHIHNETSDVPFSDKISIPEWARLAVRTAVVEGILDGYPDGTLKPMQTVNRSEMAAMVSKAMKWNADASGTPSFTDGASIPAWARSYVEAARGNGILAGRAGNRFVPDGLTTRAEASVVLLRLWNVLH